MCILTQFFVLKREEYAAEIVFGPQRLKYFLFIIWLFIKKFVDTRASAYSIWIQYTSVICVDSKPQRDVCHSLIL